MHRKRGRKNPYIKYLKQPVTMRLDRDTVSYFKSMSEETVIPHQSLINLYLRDCAVTHRKLYMNWHSEKAERIRFEKDTHFAALHSSKGVIH
ncbi:BrnA antitoxin family protein [Thermodesulfobacteriota bacterium]